MTRVNKGRIGRIGMEDGIEVNITLYGKTKTTTMSIPEWLEVRDAQYGVAPLDSITYDMLNEFT
jgi:hypothetical protein